MLIKYYEYNLQIFNAFLLPQHTYSDGEEQKNVYDASLHQTFYFIIKWIVCLCGFDKWINKWVMYVRSSLEPW